MRAVRNALAGSILLMLGACSATDILNATADTNRIEVTHDIAFGDGPRRTLDVYAPHAAKNAALAVFYYGGGWEAGDKETYRFVGAALAERGIVAVIPDYRIYPDARFPDFLNDAAAAVRWAKHNAAGYGGDPERLVLIGHSAGAYLALMLALDKTWLGSVGLDPKRDLAGAVGLAGPYDFLPLTSARLKEIFGPESQWPATQPIAYANSDAPPLLLTTGRLDLAVDPGNTRRLAAKILDAGGDVRTIEYPWIGHMLLLGAMAKPLRLFAPTLDDTAAFVASRSPLRDPVLAGATAP